LLVLEHKHDFTEQEAFIQHFTENVESRHQAQLILSKLNDADAYNVSRLFLDAFIGKPKNFNISALGTLVVFINIDWNKKTDLKMLHLQLIIVSNHFWNV
jgi:hypothetical protein